MRGKQPLETVVGVRAGLSSHRIVVMAHRDSLGSPALAELSGTAALLEMARVFKARDLRSTLVLVSTSGGSAGAAGARDFAEPPTARSTPRSCSATSPAAASTSRGSCRGPTASGRRRWGSAARSRARCCARSARRPGGSRAIGQWARRALPLTVSEQGEAARAGLPAVLLQASRRARAEPADARCRRTGSTRFGRAALRAVIALDRTVSRADDGGPFADETSRHRHGPAPAARLGDPAAGRHAAAAAAADRASTRSSAPAAGTCRWRAGSAGSAAGAVPFLLAWLWIRLLGLTGARRRAARPGAARGAAAARAGGIVALVVRPARARADLARRARRARRAARGCPRACRPAAPRPALGLGDHVLARARVAGQPVRRGAARARRARLAVRRRARDRHVEPHAGRCSSLRRARRCRR